MNFSTLDKPGHAEAASDLSSPVFSGIRQHQFELGPVYPVTSRLRNGGAGLSAVHAECFLQATDAEPTVSATVHFAQAISRQLGMMGNADEKGCLTQIFRPVRKFTLNDRQAEGSHETLERKIKPSPVKLETVFLRPAIFPFRFYASQDFEPIRHGDKQLAGAIVWRQEGLEGLLEIAADMVEPGAFKLKLSLENKTPTEKAHADNADAILLRAFLSTRIMLYASGAEFIPRP